MREIWRDIPGYRGCYKISNLGRVKTVTRVFKHATNGSGTQLRKPRIMRADTSVKGYERVCLCNKSRKYKKYFVHTLILMTFRGPKPEGMQAAHLDGNKKNNKPNNLIWATAQTNSDHKRIHGTIALGKKIWSTKLTEAKVKKIRAFYRPGKKGFGRYSISKRFGIGPTTVNKILKRITWKQVI